MSAGFSHNCEDSGHRRMRTDHPGGLLLRQKGGGGSLLFAGGELADFAGCGDSFT